MYEKVFKLHAQLLKSLAHPRRLEIINLLREQKVKVSEIQQMLSLPQANISQHLQILRKEGVVKTERKGKEIFYFIGDKRFVKASDLMREILIEKHKDDYLSNELTEKMMDLVPVVRDPVCQMRVSPKTASFACKHGDQNYYFCASGCLEKFKKNPKKYVKQK